MFVLVCVLLFVCVCVWFISRGVCMFLHVEVVCLFVHCNYPRDAISLLWLTITADVITSLLLLKVCLRLMFEAKCTFPQIVHVSGVETVRSHLPDCRRVRTNKNKKLVSCEQSKCPKFHKMV